MPHTIRLRGPWPIQQAGEQASAEQASSAGIRLTMPCSVAELTAVAKSSLRLTRRFQQPTGLTASSEVTLCLRPIAAENDTMLASVIAIELNEQDLVTLPEQMPIGTTAPSLRIAIASLLRPSNLLSLEVELTASAESSQAEFGEVWLEIED